MNELLSNEEIDTLLELFRAEGGGLDAQAEQILRVAANRGEAERCENVDLLQPRRFPRRHREALDRLFTSLDRTIAVTIADRLRLEASCECQSIERVRWSEWVARARGPMAVFVLELAQFGSRGVLTVSADLLHGAVDRLLGGAGRTGAAPSRFSNAEFTVADGLVIPLVRRIGEALSSLGDAEVRIQRRLADVHLARCVGEHDPVLAVRYGVSAEPLSGELRLVVPFADLEPHLSRALDTVEPRIAPGAMRAKTAQNLRPVRLDFRVVLGRTEMSLRELLDLRTGDLVLLGTRVGEPVEGLIQGRSKLRGLLGPRQGRMAFRVTNDGEGRDVGA